jgi:hypothetical protein
MFGCHMNSYGHISLFSVLKIALILYCLLYILEITTSFKFQSRENPTQKKHESAQFQFVPKVKFL